jgi:hypothetical protein
LVFSKGGGANTPLHIVAYAGHKAVAETLLVAKAEIDAKDKVHMTPLYWAAEIGDTNMTKIGPLGPVGLAGSATATVHLSEKLLEQRSLLRRKRGHLPTNSL